MNVVGAERLGRREHRAQHSVRPGQGAQRGDQLVGHPRDDEVSKPAFAVRDTQRRKSRTGKLPRGVDELLEHLLDRALRGDRQHGVANSFKCRAERAFGVGYLLQGIDVFLETVPLENVSVKLPVQWPRLHDDGLVTSEWVPLTAWALKLRRLNVTPEGALGSFLKRISILPLLALNRRPTTLSVIPAAVPERTIDAMSPVCRGLPDTA